MMRVLHVTASLSRRGGGVWPVVVGLARRQHGSGARVAVAGLRDEFTAQDLPAPNGIRFRGARAGRDGGLLWSRELGAILACEADQTDVIHSHGLWMCPDRMATAAARRRRLPLVVSPHGMLEPWALRRSRWKKRLCGVLYQRHDLRRADCLHATSAREVGSFRDYGLRGPVAVVPNGVEAPDPAGLPAHRDAFLRAFPRAHDRPLALFLSRLHPKKGLPHLVEAWAEAHPAGRDWLLVVVGPDSGGHRGQVEAQARSLGVADSVLFTGPLYGVQKWGAMAAAELFVLPSFSEGFSVAVLEAMGCGLPVLITPGCNFPEAALCGAGLVVEPCARGVAEGLHALMALDPRERSAMGEAGRRLVERDYTLQRAAACLLEVYEWLQGRAPRPSCVEVQ